MANSPTSEDKKAAEEKAKAAAKTKKKITTAPATFSNIKEELADRLQKSGPEVAGAIIDKMTEDEVERRTGLVTSAFEMLTGLKEEESKLKPDVIQFSEDNTDKPTMKAFSPKLNSQRQKLRKRVGNLEKAIDAAIGEKSDYKKLEEFLKNKGNEPKKSDDNEDTSN